MLHSDLERIVDEYCDNLRDKLKKNLTYFPPNWNGIHVRAMADMMVNMSSNDTIKKAKTVIKKSQVYYKMEI